MSIREYAQSMNVPVVGKLRKVKSRNGDLDIWMDEAFNEFWRVVHPVSHKYVWCIVTCDGCVI